MKAINPTIKIMNEMKCLYFITHSLLKHIIINKRTLKKMQKK